MIDYTKRCIIMRGVPGSGKSTMANWLAEMYVETQLTQPGYYDTSSKIIDGVKKYVIRNEDFNKDRIVVAIHSTDQYLYENGVYQWTPEKSGSAHNRNFKAFCQSVDKSIPFVIVDNTNTTPKEYRKYQEYAEANDYWVSFMVMPHPTVEDAMSRNTHNVPEETIQKMIERFK